MHQPDTAFPVGLYTRRVLLHGQLASCYMLVQADDSPRLPGRMEQAGSTHEEVVGDESLRKQLRTHCKETPRLLVPEQSEYSRTRVERLLAVPDEEQLCADRWPALLVGQGSEGLSRKGHAEGRSACQLRVCPAGLLVQDLAPERRPGKI